MNKEDRQKLANRFSEECWQITDEDVFEFYMKVIERDTLFSSNPNEAAYHPLANLIIRGQVNLHRALSQKEVIKMLFNGIYIMPIAVITLIGCTLKFNLDDNHPFIPEEHKGRVGLLIEDYITWGKENGYI